MRFAALAFVAVLSASALHAAQGADDRGTPARDVGGAKPSQQQAKPAPRARPNPAERPQEPPPPPSDPPVTRAEADAVMAALSAAWKAEDRAGVEKAYDAKIAWRAGRDAQKLFSERNYFTLTTTAPAEKRLPDGGLRLIIVTDLTSRALKDAYARREKRRWEFDFARRPDRGVVIAFQGAAEAGLLPPNPPWRNASLRGDVDLRGAKEKDPSIAVGLVLALKNASAQPASELAFALHPFSEGLVARQGDAVLQATRTEASIDAWTVKLAQPVPPGGDAEVSLSYTLRQPGAAASCAIGPDLVRLYAVSAWLPIIEPARANGASDRSYDLTVSVPEGMQVSMPGKRTDSERDGIAQARFVSELPSAETPLVAVTGTREERRLGPSLVLDVLRRNGGGDPAKAISHVTTLAAFLEDRLTSCPVTRLALAESGDGGFREGPGWMALPTLEVSREDADLDPEDQVFLFLGISMSRLWVVHRLAPSGLGAPGIAQGLCEHLVGNWAEAAVKKGTSAAERAYVLSFVRLDPQLDRPLLPEADDPTTPAVFKQGKARLVFDAYESLAGAGAWHDVLQAWARETPPGSPIETLVGRMGGTPERDAFLEAFFRRAGTCQVSIADIRTLPLSDEEARREGVDPGAWKRVEIDVDNAGLGPVPVDVRVEVDSRIRQERVVAPEFGRATLSFLAGNPPVRIQLDPDRVLWQADSDDDAWPMFKHKKRDEFGEAELLGKGGDIRDSEIRRPER